MNELLKSKFFGIALVLASLIALILSGYSSYLTRSYAECQSMVTERLINANMARAAAAEEDRASDRAESEATALLIQTIFDSSSSGDRKTAYEKYKKTLSDVAEQRALSAKNRAENPLPEPPSEVCH